MPTHVLWTDPSRTSVLESESKTKQRDQMSFCRITSTYLPWRQKHRLSIAISKTNFI